MGKAKVSKSASAKVARSLDNSGMYGTKGGRPAGGGGMISGGDRPRSSLPKTTISPNVTGHAGPSKVGKVVSTKLPRGKGKGK